MGDFPETMKEKLEILDGTRAKTARDRAAVRVVDLRALLALPTLKSVELTASPTLADYNALRSDLKEVHSRLFQIADVLRKLTA